MIKKIRKVDFLKLVEWPLNICVFELGFGYGIGKTLSMFHSEIPLWIYLVILYFVSFISAIIVYRYMPSDIVINEVFQSDIWAIVWINISIFLSALVPVVSIMFYNSIIFWISSVIIAALKTIHSLEIRRIKSKKIVFITKESSREKNTSNSRIIRFLFSKNPDAYALSPILTATLISAVSLGFAIELIGKEELILLGYLITVISIAIYVILSAISRMRNLKNKKSKLE